MDKPKARESFENLRQKQEPSFEAGDLEGVEPLWAVELWRAVELWWAE